MHVLLVNAVYTGGGAAFAMQRLASALKAHGVDVTMLFLEHAPAKRNTVVSRLRIRIPILASKLVDRLPLLLSGNRLDNFRYLKFSSAFLKRDSSALINQIGADIVNLHWVNYGQVSPEGLAKIEAPVIWTAHDMWPFTGGCHHSGCCQNYRDECGHCWILKSDSGEDRSHLLWQRKWRSWKGRDISLVCPSNWLAQRARQSSLFRERAVSVIPNPLDLTTFSPGNQNDARARLGLPGGVPLILFGANKGLQNPAKGFSYLDVALQKMTQKSGRSPPHLVVLGSGANSAGLVKAKVPVHFLGKVGQDEIAFAYRAADVFALPSVFENLPNMVGEALACGTPSVCFDVGGIGDLVDHGINGYLAAPFDASGIEQGLCFVLDRDAGAKAKMRQAARRAAEIKLEPVTIAKAYIRLFDEAVRRREEAGQSLF